MKKYLNSVVAKFDTTASGNAATGTTITVRDSSTGFKVALYSDDGVTAKDNPFTVDNNGNYEFYVADGRYDIYQDEGLPSQLILRDVSIFDVSINFGAPKTVTALVSNVFNFGVGSLLTVGGYSSQGDGGTGQWLKTSDTDTASQSPLVRQDGTLTDVRGAVWRIVPSGALDPRAVGFTGTADNTAALLASCNAVGQGGKVALDKSYSFELGSVSLSHGVDIDLANSTITSTTTAATFDIEGSFDSGVSVSSVSGDTVVVSDASSLNIGDIVKVTSEDEQPDFWLAGRFIGQFATITDKVGNTLTLDREIDDDNLYLTNVMLYVLENQSATIENATIISGPLVNDHIAFIRLSSLIKPQIKNINAEGSRDANFKFIGCFGYHVADCSAKNSLNNPGTGNYGYGVEDLSCDGGYIENFSFENGRHAFTNNSFKGDGVDAKCGYTTNLRVVSSSAYKATSGAWDTHPGAINVDFINCKAFNCQSFGQSRSRNTRFINPYGRDLITGVKATGGKTGSTINPMQGLVIQNADLEYSETAIEYYASSPEASADPAEMYIESGIFKPTGSYRGFLIEARNAPISAIFKNVNVRIGGVDTDAAILIGPDDFHKVYIDGMNLLSYSNSAASFSTVKGSSSLSGLTYDIKVLNVVMEGSGFSDLPISTVSNADAHIYNVRVEDVGTGSLVAVDNGTSLTWGASV